jgi:2-oxoisovalerate dehydrogenase E1 component
LDTLSNNSEISADLLDLRTLQPLDTEAIFESVKKTGRVIIYQEDSMFGGVASDISALIMEECFKYLDAPVKGCQFRHAHSVYKSTRRSIFA